MTIPEKLYRYHDFATTNGVGVQESEFPVTKETPCGYWIDWWGTKKWVSKTARKRFAYPTKEEAETSFIARKRCQIKILEGQLRQAKAALAIKNGEPTRNVRSPLTLRNMFGRLIG